MIGKIGVSLPGIVRFVMFWTRVLAMTPQSVQLYQRFQTFLPNSRLTSSAAVLRAASSALVRMVGELGVHLRVLEPAEVQGQLAGLGVDGRRRGGVPPVPLLARLHAGVVAPRQGLERPGQGEADVLALLDRRRRDGDLVAEHLVPHRHEERHGLDVERVVGGVEAELDLVRAELAEAGVHLRRWRPPGRTAGSRCPPGSRPNRAGTGRSPAR